MQYDIMQVEDDSGTRGFIERAAQSQDLTYFGVPSLQALEEALPESSARIYLVDGRFPIVAGEVVEQNSQKAIASIRHQYPDARIMLFSGEMDGDAIARENNVEFCSKGNYTARSLVAKIKESL
jgi:DNA-binding NtrC family response regulator